MTSNVEDALSILREVLGEDGTIYQRVEAALAQYSVSGEAAPQPSKDAARLDWLADDLVIEGFVNVKMDIYEFATDVAEENGREEPTKDDVRIGLRRLIDAAITGEKE